jgi:hypothetical protein
LVAHSRKLILETGSGFVKTPRRAKGEAADDNARMTEPAYPPPLPDRLSIDPAQAPHHVPAVFEHGVGIRLNDKERFDVQEYCISEGWIKVPAGKTASTGAATRC